VQPATGQKTGWFFDQTDNRLALRRFGSGRVLDAFCWLGAWGLQAAAGGGAAAVTFVDSSAAALEQVRATAASNGLKAPLDTCHGDAFDVLRTLHQEDARFDVVVLDPPAFIKRRRDEAEGLRAYQRLNRLGLALLAPDGILVTASCSSYPTRDTFTRIVQRAARRTGRTLQLLRAAGAGPDHPVQPAIAETEYLKTLFFRAITD
jgi:23S rRNA (cytosine1962-C5)-methyltransferase